MMRKVNRMSQLICLAALCFALGVMLFDPSLKNSPFGPAAYYYTDIPNWQDRFYGSARLAVPGSEILLWPALLVSLGAAWLFLKLLVRFNQGTISNADGADNS